MNVIICGAGIMGASVSYYLAKRGVRCTVIERCSPACAASGKAGGFLARDWSDHSELGPLSRLSFDLHAELAKELSNTDYRPVDTLSIRVTEGAAKSSKHDYSDIPDWLDGIQGRPNVLGTQETTAQVHPFKLTNSLLDAAKRLVGTTVRQAAVTGLVTDAGRVTGVVTDGGDTVSGDVVVIAMGPWTGRGTEQWLPGGGLPITGDPAHSIVLQPEKSVTAHALFYSYRQTTGGKNIDPEIYPRPDGTVYVCGRGVRPPLPDDPSSVKSNDCDCNALQRVASSTSTVLSNASLVASNLCYLPTTPDGLPVIGKIPGIEGLYVASGHSCWGILNGPATGCCLAELITDGQSRIDLTPFDPARFF